MHKQSHDGIDINHSKVVLQGLFNHQAGFIQLDSKPQYPENSRALIPAAQTLIAAEYPATFG